MKRITVIFTVLLLVISLGATGTFTAYSATNNQTEYQSDSMLLQEDSNIDLTDPNLPLPIDVIQSPEEMEIRKIYELPADADPGFIPHNDFLRNNIQYKCSDILREVVMAEDKKSLTETETVESANKNMDTILGLLPQYKEIETEDGYVGTLQLDTTTIKTEVSGYGSKTSTTTIVREYPNLSDADLSYVPKTVEENGKTYIFQDVEWQKENWANVDDYEIPNRYKARVTYSGSSTSSYVKGYVTNAEYTGEVTKSDISVIRYTVIFYGTEVSVKNNKDGGFAGEIAKTFSENSWLYIILFAILAAGALIFIASLYKKRKEVKDNEASYDYEYPDYEDDGSYADDGDSGYPSSDDGGDV